uniref:Uncharacterized protein n=1 Tax=Heterorhabditis bacteriophora TaxID=37862 RepID=A0A1I7WAN6_HETBA
MPEIRTEPYFLSCGTELVKFVKSDEKVLFKSSNCGIIPLVHRSR